MDLDWTLEQREEFAPSYYDRPARSGAIAALNRARQRIVWNHVTVFTPWSQWAADSLQRSGIDEARIKVLPPGVDMQRWHPANVPPPPSPDGRLRLLFVGGDFRRKGGELLLEVMRSAAGARFALDIVTRDPVTPTRGVTVHRLESGDPALAELYQRADVFVMPSFAECFGIATIEAMASGLPALVSDRGASREIVEQAHTGWLIEPTVQHLHDRLVSLADDPTSLRPLGCNARASAAARFDGHVNDRRIADLVLELSHR